MELGGQNICSTTFAPHVWHLRDKLGVNLPHLPHLPQHPNRLQKSQTYHGTVWMVGVNIYPKENDLPLPFAPPICLLGCLDGVVNVEVNEIGRAGPTTNLLQFANFYE
jgi:hypothetical protein